MQTHMRLEIIVNDVVLQLQKSLRRTTMAIIMMKKKPETVRTKLSRHSTAKVNVTKTSKKLIHCIIQFYCRIDKVSLYYSILAFLTSPSATTLLDTPVLPKPPAPLAVSSRDSQTWTSATSIFSKIN